MGGLQESLLPLFEATVLYVRSKGVPELAGIILTAIAVPLFSWYALSWASSPIRNIPGPFLAGWTNLWRLRAVRSNKYALIMAELHKKYGPAVRIGPNTVTLDYPELIKTIYGTDGKFLKTEFYAASSAMIEGKIHYTLFGEPNPDTHAVMKRPVAKYYTTGAAQALEPQMDRAFSEFCAQVDKRFARTGEVCDMWTWSLYLMWDVSSYIIFSRRFGYLEHGSDFDNSISLSATINSYFQLVGQMPWIDFWLDKNPLVKIGPVTFTSLTKLAVDGYTARLTGNDKDFNPDAPDYLQHYIDAKSEHPDVVNDGAVIGYTMLHIIAGADTTAIVTSTVLYYVLSHPDVLSKLVDEVRAAGIPKDQPFPYNVARQLPYLDAVWLEVSRLQPIAGMLYERYAPAEGLTLPNGTFIPPGTVIGLNPYITGRNQSVFGPDADTFRPERWLKLPGEGVEEWNSRLRLQRSVVDLNFGAGSRICLGKNLGIVETYKIIAIMVNRYEMALDGDGGWEVVGGWVRKPKALRMKMRVRD